MSVARHVLVSLKIAAIWFAVLLFLGATVGELSGGGHESILWLIVAFYGAALCSVIHIIVRLVRDVRATRRPTES